MTAIRILDRSYQGEADFWKVRQFLIETYPITPTDFNWEIRRWEGWHMHNIVPTHTQALDMVHLWETEVGQLVGVVHPEGRGDAWLELHPDYRHLIEVDMIAWAEQHLAVRTDDGKQRRVEFFVQEYDSPRRRLLAQRGYEKTPWSGVMRRLRLGSQPLPKVVVADGYVMRLIRPQDTHDAQGIADILNAAFNRTFHTGAEFATFAACAPSFRADLQLVAEALAGSFAAHLGFTYDEANRRGIVEPVCTHPDHRRHGLARALMAEGLHRLQALGATAVYVGTGDAIPANEFYEAVGFTEAYVGYTWRKVF
ncbi:MAG TPA: GNAT family N-acetyltransferase [Phototrophicaceae bacterium]|nr:GNAT family N-acetyltransferase [Phototrophicaceae bacterium]